MATGHTGEVRLEFDIYLFFKKIRSKDTMIAKNAILLTFSSKNHLKFSLHYHKAKDIKPIEKINVLGMGLRHCSTTFYL